MFLSLVLWWFSCFCVFGAYCQANSVTILMKVSNNRANNSIDKKCVIDKLHHIILYVEYTSPLAGFEFTTLVLISTNFTGGFKSNYHTITTTKTRNYFKMLTFKQFDNFYEDTDLKLHQNQNFHISRINKCYTTR